MVVTGLSGTPLRPLAVETRNVENLKAVMLGALPLAHRALVGARCTA